MSRFFNTILMLIILTTQSAWAMSGGMLYDLDPEQPQNISQVDDQHDEAADSCSHFCHASAHMLGIFSSISFDIVLPVEKHVAQRLSIETSIKYQPPTPPPTA
jgi:hypothetical protein